MENGIIKIECVGCGLCKLMNKDNKNKMREDSSPFYIKGTLQSKKKKLDKLPPTE